MNMLIVVEKFSSNSSTMFHLATEIERTIMLFGFRHLFPNALDTKNYDLPTKDFEISLN
jgi:hypothetical protein